MIESASHRFIELLEAHRDDLYTQAMTLAPSDYAETLLQQAVRQVFKGMVEQSFSEADLCQQIIEVMRSGKPPSPVTVRPTDTNVIIMPAATWARLTAAVQIEAARLGGAAEQSMLAYDPLLAPKKKKNNDDDLNEGFNLSPWTRFVVAAAIVLFIGIVASIVLTTRRVTTGNATRPATTMPAGAKTPAVPTRAKP